MKISCVNCQNENDVNSKYCSDCGYILSSYESNKVGLRTENLKITESNKKKFYLKTFIGFIIGFVIMFFVTQYFLNPSFNVDKELVKVSSEMNKNCPIIIDQYLTLDNTSAYPNKTLQYNYSIIGHEKSEINLDTVKKYLFDGILENIKNNPDMKTLKDHKVTFNYYYKDKNGKFVTKYIVTPEMYGIK